MMMMIYNLSIKTYLDCSCNHTYSFKGMRSKLFSPYGSTLNVTVENSFGDSDSNPRRYCLHFASLKYP